MKKPKPFSIGKRLNSFKYAFQGLKLLLKEEHNARIHIVAATLVIVAGFLFKLNTVEWMLAILCIALVLTTEAINSSIENLADMVSPETHPQIKKIKDIGAAAVLIVALAAAIIGGIIFFPKIWDSFG